MNNGFIKTKDREGRIAIPIDLVEQAELSNDIIICLSQVDDEYTLKNRLDQTPEDRVLAFRKLDSKGRVYFPKTFPSNYLVFLKGGVVTVVPVYEN